MTSLSLQTTRLEAGRYGSQNGRRYGGLPHPLWPPVSIL
jgi:hypothetical protein